MCKTEPTQYYTDEMYEFVRNLTDRCVMFHLFTAKYRDVGFAWAGHEQEFITTGMKWDNPVSWILLFGTYPRVLGDK